MYMPSKLKNVLLLTAFLGLTSAGCSSVGLFGAEVKTVKTTATPPANVTTYVSVEDGGKPVGYLTRDNFKIYENDVLLDQDAIGLRLLPRDEEASGFCVLLIDLSQSPTETELKRIARGAAHFVETVTTTQPVTVVAFDGSERAREVARFSKVETATKRPLPDLSAFLGKDTSRDLNSALIAAVQGVQQELEKSGKEGRFGTVVTMTRGPDLAMRRDDNDVRNAVTVSGLEFYSLSPKGGEAISTLAFIGQDGRFDFETIDTLPMRIQDLAMEVRSAWFSRYVVSYCSPARGGERKMRIKVSFEGRQGSTKSGSSSTYFNATDFSSGCNMDELHPLTNQPTSPASQETGDPQEESPVSAQEALPDSAARKTAPRKAPPKKALPKKSTGQPSVPSDKPVTPPEPPEIQQEPEVIAPPDSGKYE